MWDLSLYTGRIAFPVYMWDRSFCIHVGSLFLYRCRVRCLSVYGSDLFSWEETSQQPLRAPTWVVNVTLLEYIF